MRPMIEIRTSTTNQHNKSLSNGDLSESTLNKLSSASSSPPHLSISSNTNATSNGLDRPLIVTRSKTVKVLRSGRRALLSSPPWKKSNSSSSVNPHNNHVNGYVKLKNRTLNVDVDVVNVNGMSSKQRSCTLNGRKSNTRRNSSTSSPGKDRSAYAKHYKSYRRNSATTRRNLMLSRSPSTPPPSSSSHQNQRSRKFKSTTPNSGRLRPSSNLLQGTRTTRRRIVQKVNVVKSKEHKPKNPPSPSNGSGSPKPLASRSAKSRSVSASSACSISIPTPLSSPRFGDKEKVQRRSALWVLNCEAEEFLFGETAADKHELELPPSSSTSPSTNGGYSPPPKKRRRWRETELSHLLETSPFLESKLRSNSASSCSSNPSPEDGGGGECIGGSGSGSRRGCNSACKNGQRLYKHKKSITRVNVKLNFDQPRRKQKYKNGNSSAESSPQRGRKNGKVAMTKSMKTFRKRFEEFRESQIEEGNNVEVKDEEKELPHVLDVGPSSFINFNCELLSPRSNNSIDKALLLKETLEQVKWSFSFEHPHTDESWYTTFSRSRGGDYIMSYKSFLISSTISGIHPPLLLPYQLDKSHLLRRKRKKLPKNSRKSPRCHASTLAILSSTDSPLVPGGTITAESASASPVSPSNPSPTLRPHDLHHRTLPISAPSDASLEALLISTSSTPHHPPPPMLSPFTKFVAENSVRITRKRNSSAYQDPYQLYQKTQQVSAAAASTSKGHFSTRNQAQNQVQDDLLSTQQYLWDSIQFLSDPYVVSLLAGDDPIIHHHLYTPSATKCSNTSSISTRTRHASAKSDGVCRTQVPLPKGSPNKQGSVNFSSTNNVVAATTNGKNGTISLAVPHPLRSPPPHTTRSSTSTFSCSNPPQQLSPMTPTPALHRSPMVVVADILRNHPNKKVHLHTHGLLDEERLFVWEGLPPLPLW